MPASPPNSRSIYIIYILIFILYVQVIFQQYLISSMRQEIQGLYKDQAQNVEFVSRVGAHLEDERQDRLQAQSFPEDFGSSLSVGRYSSSTGSSSSSKRSSTSGNPSDDTFKGFDVNAPSPKNMPAKRLSDAEEKAVSAKRKFYGGKGDPLHLGGFTQRDQMGISTNLWNFMLGPLSIRSIVDVGCGRGHSTSYFMNAGAKVLCVEGSHDAVMQSLLPPEVIVEHDFSLGPWWPEATYDALWCVEFLEHVSRQYMHNYLPIMRKAALLFVTSSPTGGWHHVEVHEDWWWIGRFTALGFVYSKELTTFSRKQAENQATTIEEAQHIRHRLLVFVNPKVASLKRHHHIFGGNGCFKSIVDNRDGGLRCKAPDTLPMEYESLLQCNRTLSTKGNSGRIENTWNNALWQCDKRTVSSRTG